MNVKFAAGILSLLFLSFTMAVSASEPVLYQNKNLIVHGTEQSIKDNPADPVLQKVQYTIDLVPNEEKEKAGSFQLSFDYLFSPENRRAEMKNLSIEPVEAKGSWKLESYFSGIAGAGTDLCAVEYLLTASDADGNYAADTLCISGDQNGKFDFASPQQINWKDDARKQYDESRKIKKFLESQTATGYRPSEKLVKSGELICLENTKLSYQINEYQSDTELLTGVEIDSKALEDLYTKTARYEISLNYDQEPIGREQILIGRYWYSPAANYSTMGISASQMEGYDNWVFENSETCVGTNTGLCLFSSDMQIKNGASLMGKLRITVTADAQGNLTLKPILVL